MADYDNTADNKRSREKVTERVSDNGLPLGLAVICCSVYYDTHTITSFPVLE